MSRKKRMQFRVNGNEQRGTGLIRLSHFNLRVGFFLVMGVLLFGKAAAGHHGGSEWDSKNTITVQGMVTEFRFINPHAQIFFDVRDVNGNMVHWSCEAPDPAMLVRQGWTRNSVKSGDTITLEGHPAKSGAKALELEKLTLAGGQVLNAKGNGGQ